MHRRHEALHERLLLLRIHHHLLRHRVLLHLHPKPATATATAATPASRVAVGVLVPPATAVVLIVVVPLHYPAAREGRSHTRPSAVWPSGSRLPSTHRALISSSRQSPPPASPPACARPCAEWGPSARAALPGTFIRPAKKRKLRGGAKTAGCAPNLNTWTRVLSADKICAAGTYLSLARSRTRRSAGNWSR